MPSYLVPNSALAKGRIKKATVQALSSISMSASASPQAEIDIPTYGDILGFEVVLTQLTAGTLTDANSVDYAIQGIAIKDRSGRPILSKIRGKDLPQLDRMLNIGRSRTVPDTANSANTHRFFLPCNIEKKDQTSRLQLTLAPYSDMATGATGGTVSIDVIAWYVDQSNIDTTQRIFRISQSIDSGLKRFGPSLPKGVVIQHLLFKVGTESNITDITFSADGKAELQDVRPTDLQAIEDVRLSDGHVTGQFTMLNTPFVSTDRTILDVTGAGSDTIEWFIIVAD